MKNIIFEDKKTNKKVGKKREETVDRALPPVRRTCSPVFPSISLELVLDGERRRVRAMGTERECRHHRRPRHFRFDGRRRWL